MTLSEVQQQMVPGAKAAFEQALDLEEATQAFQLTLIDVVLKTCDGVQSRAARKLGVTPANISKAVNGQIYRRAFRKIKAAAESPESPETK